MAIALFAGFFFARKWLAVFVPLCGIVIADLFFLGAYQLEVMCAVYVASLLPVVMGYLIKQRRARELSRMFLPLTVSSIFSALLFFAMTNLAFWVFTGIYGLSFGGFINCMIAAIPFLKWTLASNLAYGAAFFGSYWLWHHFLGMSKSYSERNCVTSTYSVTK